MVVQYEIINRNCTRINKSKIGQILVGETFWSNRIEHSAQISTGRPNPLRRLLIIASSLGPEEGAICQRRRRARCRGRVLARLAAPLLYSLFSGFISLKTKSVTESGSTGSISRVTGALNRAYYTVP